MVAPVVSPCTVFGSSASADWGSIKKRGVWLGVVAEERVLGIFGGFREEGKVGICANQVKGVRGWGKGGMGTYMHVERGGGG